jgi:hypothetical protein
MDERDIKMRCLELAVARGGTPEDVIATAQILEGYVMSRREFAVIGAPPERDTSYVTVASDSADPNARPKEWGPRE